MTTEDAEVRRERGELFFVHSSGCPRCVLGVSRLLFHVGSRQDPFDPNRAPQPHPGHTNRAPQPRPGCNSCYRKIGRAIARSARFFHRLPEFTPAGLVRGVRQFLTSQRVGALPALPG